MRENNRKPIEKCRKKLPQFTTMNVIDGQAGLVSYFSLIFYSLTIDNILNIIVLLILAGVTIATLTGDNGILKRAQEAKQKTEQAEKDEKYDVEKQVDYINEYLNGVEVETVTDTKPGELEVDETEADTYIINSIEDLVVFAYDVTTGNTYERKTVKLGLSLDFNSTKSYVDSLRTDYEKYGYNGELKTLLTSGDGFIPIGTINNVSQSLYSFSGTFDGNEKIIYNLYINKNVKDDLNDLRVGLFGNNYGTIEKLGLVNCYIKGGLDNNASNTAIVGGITGYDYGNIKECFVSGNIYGSGSNNSNVRVGGIVGSINNGNINNCYNIASLLSSGNSQTYVGGIVGYILTTGNVSNCYNIGELENNNTGGPAVSGGIVGWITSSTTLTINNCYNIGEINLKGTAQIAYIGGIAGRGAIVNINNSNNKCRIILDDFTTDYLNIGQIAGIIEGNIKDCYYFNIQDYNSVGTIEGTDESKMVENESDMPNILSIVGNCFKEGPLGYPVLYWE